MSGKPIRVYHHPRDITIKSNIATTLSHDNSPLETFKVVSKSVGFELCPNNEEEIITRIYVGKVNPLEIVKSEGSS